jgi:pimeloyl-ACP methyl ester carboxylesterase
MKAARIILYVIALVIFLSFLNHVEILLAAMLGITCSLILLDLIISIIQQAFLRFDDEPGTAQTSADTFTVETLSIHNMHATLVKSRATPATRAPVVILHHGYGSTYRRMLVYAYPLALNGYAVLLYNTRGHGKIVKQHDGTVNEHSPGDKTEILEIMKALNLVVEFIASRQDIDAGRIGFMGISLGAIVGLTYGACNPAIKCVIVLAPLTSDWWMKKSFEWSGLEMNPSKLQDFLVSPVFYAGKELGFFDHPVWSSPENASKIYLLHCEDDGTIPFFNFEANIKAFHLPPDHYLAFRKGNHWFIRQEHLVIGQVLKWLGERLQPIN